jgi:hypothetical protein
LKLGTQRVPPLVRSQVDELAMLVADVAPFQPATQRPAVVLVPHRMVPIRIAGGSREQHGRALGPAALQTLALLADGLLKLLIDRDKRLPVHLVVEIAQIRGSVGVADHAVARQTQRVADPQPAAHQDDGDQAVIGGCSTGRGSRRCPVAPSRAHSAPGEAAAPPWGSLRGRTSRSSGARCPSRAGGSR